MLLERLTESAQGNYAEVPQAFLIWQSDVTMTDAMLGGKSGHCSPKHRSSDQSIHGSIWLARYEANLCDVLVKISVQRSSLRLHLLIMWRALWLEAESYFGNEEWGPRRDLRMWSPEQLLEV